MKQIVIISGKGGTGKTVVSGALATLAPNKVMVDCDVDAANLHLLLNATIRERHEFRCGATARIDQERCNQCGQCVEACRFAAISDAFHIDPVSCEGCGYCALRCPVEAITMEENRSGEWYISDTAYGPFVHARLGIAEENSGKLVTHIKQAAEHVAKEQELDYMLVDGPPGIGCPVIASLSGADAVVAVTEPTPSGRHDLERVLELAAHFQIRAMVVINKADLNPAETGRIQGLCQHRGLPVIGQLPFSDQVVEAVAAGRPVTELPGSGLKEPLTQLWQTIAGHLH